MDYLGDTLLCYIIGLTNFSLFDMCGNRHLFSRNTLLLFHFSLYLPRGEMNYYSWGIIKYLHSAF